MGEILPDGTIQGYQAHCNICNKSYPTNIQGNHSHVCEMGSTDQVVKDLDWFLNEVAKELYDRAYDCSYDNSWELHSEANERWYKHQLEEKDKEFKALHNAWKEFNNDLLGQIETLIATIAERDREIEKVTKKYKFSLKQYGCCHKEVIQLSTTIEKQKKDIEKEVSEKSVQFGVWMLEQMRLEENSYPGVLAYYAAYNAL